MGSIPGFFVSFACVCPVFCAYETPVDPKAIKKTNASAEKRNKNIGFLPIWRIIAHLFRKNPPGALQKREKYAIIPTILERGVFLWEE